MEMLGKIIALLTVPIMILNFFGGIISGIWLAILGEWSIIGYGIVGLLGGAFIISLAMLPGMILIFPATIMLEKSNKFIGYIFGFLASAYTMFVVSAWCILVLIYFTNHATSDSIIPVLIWSYGIATGPINYMAQKEMQAGNQYGGIAAFFIQICYILSVLAMLFIGIELLHVLIIFGVFMSISLIIQFITAYMIEQTPQYY